MENRVHFYGSPGSSSEPICRICHEGDSKETLFSFCKCAGTLAMAHRSCLEKWLSTANSTSCEICKFGFKTSRKPRPITDWFKHSDASRDTNNLIGDLVCFLVLTPLTIVSTYLCVIGAIHYIDRKGGKWEASGLIVLSVILATVYCVWLGATIRHHIRTMKKWRENHQSVELLGVRGLEMISIEINNNTSINCPVNTSINASITTSANTTVNLSISSPVNTSVVQQPEVSTPISARVSTSVSAPSNISVNNSIISHHSFSAHADNSLS